MRKGGRREERGWLIIILFSSVKAIIDYIKLADFQGPLVIMGDFNNEDDSLVIK